MCTSVHLCSVFCAHSYHRTKNAFCRLRNLIKAASAASLPNSYLWLALYGPVAKTKYVSVCVSNGNTIQASIPDRTFGFPKGKHQQHQISRSPVPLSYAHLTLPKNSRRFCAHNETPRFSRSNLLTNIPKRQCAQDLFELPTRYASFETHQMYPFCTRISRCELTLR